MVVLVVVCSHSAAAAASTSSTGTGTTGELWKRRSSAEQCNGSGQYVGRGG